MDNNPYTFWYNLVAHDTFTRYWRNLPWYKRLWYRIKYYAKKAAGWLTDE